MAKKRPPRDLASAIREKGFNWQAGPTSLLAMSPEERRAHLGLSPTPEELRASTQAIRAAEALRAAQRTFGAPASVDWRSNNGNWTTPVKDQASCGSCVSFATCATLEARIKIACRDASSTPDLSEAHLFYCGCGNCCGSGWNFPPALDFCRQTGVARETDFPYTPNDQPCRTGLQSYAKITAWTQVLAAADRKNVIATKGPMVAGMAVFSDFYSYQSGVYRHATGVLEGYHAVSVVGYDDAQSCWICKNSWGPGWGESGWFRIGYGESIDTEFPFYDMDTMCPAPDTGCQEHVPTLVRVIYAARANRALRACLRYYVCHEGFRPRCTAAHLVVVRGVLAILRQCPQYRASFCRAMR